MSIKTTITLKDEVLEFEDSKEAEYQWQVGVAGELILYVITLHEMLSAKSHPRVYQVWAAGEWEHVIDDEV